MDGFMKIIKKPNLPAPRGQSLVEFAVSLVVLLLLLVLIVDAARILFTYMALRDAAQEGALYGSLCPDDHDYADTTCGNSNIEDHARNASDMVRGFGPSNVQVQVSYNSINHCVGAGITIRVTYTNYPLTMPFLGTILGRQTIPISATATDTILRPRCS